MMAKINEIFGRVNEFGTVDILYVDDGESVTSIEDAPEFIKNIRHTYGVPQPSGSVRYDHDEIIITLGDAILLGIEIEA
ncbi:hypothetical protein [Salmonella sp. 741265052_HSA]|uniref:hypothetical protein n=1 Tax=Salmonella sp. 741265052_HSA TaxID=3388977 RepID=UPI003980BAB2